VKRGTARAEVLWAHSVHVEVSGLDPDRWYWYRFRAGGAESPIGRTRTLPKEGASADRLRFAFASCQHFETGLFTAYQHMAQEDLDVVFHLGDYIYEGPAWMPGRASTSAASC
jgi:alkaline phosphatase D